MNRTKLIITSLMALLLVSCGGKSFISDKDYAQQVESDYDTSLYADGGHH